MKRMLVTGSSGLIGSEVCVYFHGQGWLIHGVDNNSRATFFGPNGDTRWNQRRLQADLKNFRHHELDIRNRKGALDLIQELKPDVIVHTAAQPSHDLAAKIPFDDFDTNAVGTFNLLEATRLHTPDTVFVHMSTNKVYGDAPNELPLVEQAKRWDYASPLDFDGIAEQMRIDQSKHSLFGASKVAADIMVQEYGRYFGMKTCCLRGGCLTGPNHSGVELHGFLSYLIKCNLEGKKYYVFGYIWKEPLTQSWQKCHHRMKFVHETDIHEEHRIWGAVFKKSPDTKQLCPAPTLHDWVNTNPGIIRSGITN